MADIEKPTDNKSVLQFSKEQLVKSNKYENRRDLLNALLKNDTKYTLEQVDKIIESFMKGAVK